jgi:tripartite-type tricarboxylate transporter receptor subunit TctC
VESGRVRLLATLAARRSPRWKDVPTLSELGHGIVATSPYGIAGPKGLAPEVVQTLHDAFRAAMQEPAHLAELAKYDQELAYLGPQDYGQAMQKAYEAERRTVERLGLAVGGR